MVIDVPDEFKGVSEAMLKFIAEVGALGAKTTGGQAVDYARIEANLAERSAEIERAAHQALLARLDVDSPRVWIGGDLYTRVGRSEACYYTLAGAVRVERSLYRQNGRRNAKVVDAVSLRAGVIANGWLPATAQAMAHECQQVTPREAMAAATAGRLPYSRSSFQRITHRVGEQYLRVRVEVERDLMAAFEVPEAAASVSVAMDRVSVPMEEPRPRPRGRPRKGAPRKPIAVKFRMAYVGTLTLHDRKGDAIHTIRHGGMPGTEAKPMCQAMALDLIALLRKRPDLRVVQLADGAPEMWNLLDEVVRQADLGEEPFQLVDLWHLLEKLAAAHRALHGTEGEAVAALMRHRMMLLNDDEAAMKIHKELVASGQEELRVGDERPVHDAMTYLLNNLLRMDYAGARRRALPIGSGNTEATCKTLFGQRLKRSGARWKEPTGEHIVQLRALALSDRWGQAMRLTLAPLRRAVRAAA